MINTPASSSDSPLIVFAGGGTGGHLYPALSVAQALSHRTPHIRFKFFATQRAIDRRILAACGWELIAQRLPNIRRAPWRWPGLIKGYRAALGDCRLRFEQDRPAVVVGTGGWASVPAMRVARRAGIATAMLNPDSVPGRANRFLTRYTDVVFVQWHESAQYFARSGGAQVTGCPVRTEFHHVDRTAGLIRFGLDPHKKTLLITGASQGARSVNEAVAANVGFFETQPDWQVLHLTGEADFETVRQAYSGRAVHARSVAYTEHMADALAAADLVVSRAGASTLAEITAVGRPAILMPYPHHRDMHQLANARCLVRASAARIVSDAADPSVNAPALRLVLDGLMTDHAGRAAMAAAARAMGRGHAASAVADGILALASRRGGAVGGETLEQTLR